MKRIAVLGDIHGCIIEFQELYNHLQWQSLDEIWTVGDLVDRGPDSGAVVQFCMDNNIKSVMGNHDDVIVNHWKRRLKEGFNPRKQDKVISLSQLNEERIAWLEKLPPLHVMDDENLILVHAGIWPKIPLYKQPYSVIRAQLINPDLPGAVRWWGDDAMDCKPNKTEDESRKEGWERWYRLYDHEQNCIYGHSVFAQPFIHQNPGCGMTIGVDTGSCFGGSITACIYENNKEPYFLSVKSKQVWYNDTKRSWWER